jgi:hypothetical protein
MKSTLLRVLAFLRLYEASVLHEYPRTYREELERQMMKKYSDAASGSCGLAGAARGINTRNYYFSRSPRRGYLAGLGIMTYLEVATARDYRHCRSRARVYVGVLTRPRAHIAL